MKCECGRVLAKVQIADEDWKCPRCGADDGHFYIDYYHGLDEEQDECLNLHADDVVVCVNCGYEASGKTLAKNYARKMELVTCPHCRGKGVVKSGAKDLEQTLADALHEVLSLIYPETDYQKIHLDAAVKTAQAALKLYARKEKDDQ